MPIGITNVVQGDPYTALNRRIANLERLVRELAASPTLQAATISQGGISVTRGGSVQVVDADGIVIAQVGALPPGYNRADGSPQPGVIFAREDGSTAAVLADLNPTVAPFQQSLQITDRQFNVIVADDTNSGVGIARPHLSVGTLVDTNTTRWPSTTSSSWVTIGNAYIERQNPKLNWTFFLNADTGVTAQFRLLLASTQIGTVQTVTGSFATWNDIQPIPSSQPFGAMPLLELQARVTAGTGAARGQQLFLSGAQS